MLEDCRNLVRDKLAALLCPGSGDCCAGDTPCQVHLSTDDWLRIIYYLEEEDKLLAASESNEAMRSAQVAYCQQWKTLNSTLRNSAAFLVSTSRTSVQSYPIVPAYSQFYGLKIGILQLQHCEMFSRVYMLIKNKIYLKPTGYLTTSIDEYYLRST